MEIEIENYIDTYICIYAYIEIYMHIEIYKYIYVYIERSGDRERERGQKIAILSICPFSLSFRSILFTFLCTRMEVLI